MGNVVSNIIGGTAMYIASVYMWKKLYSAHINFKRLSFYIWSFLFTFIIILNYFYNFVFVRIIFITFIMTIANRIIFSHDYKSTILSTVISEFIICASDILFGIIVIYILRINLNGISFFYGTLFANFFVLFLCVYISNLKVTKYFYMFLLGLIDRAKSKKIVFYALLVIFSLNILLASIYFKLNTYYLVFINTVMILIYSYVIVKNFETSSRSEIVKAQNDSLMSSLHQYEDMVDRQRVDNHENKNQLLIIKNMIKKKDKDVVKYIDTIVKDQKEDDEALYTRVMTIPSGGLQGIIYQKMLVMKDEHIKFSLDVGRGVRDFELDKLSMDDNYRLCKIVGVFLDNAIEESRKINDKCIMISLYVDDDNLVIEVSNRFEGKIDIDKLDESGYTTKGDGHGYGLSLVKKILSETDKFENVRSINRNVFKQIIKIKNT